MFKRTITNECPSLSTPNDFSNWMRDRCPLSASNLSPTLITGAAHRLERRLNELISKGEVWTEAGKDEIVNTDQFRLGWTPFHAFKEKGKKIKLNRSLFVIWKFCKDPLPELVWKQMAQRSGYSSRSDDQSLIRWLKRKIILITAPVCATYSKTSRGALIQQLYANKLINWMASDHFSSGPKIAGNSQVIIGYSNKRAKWALHRVIYTMRCVLFNTVERLAVDKQLFAAISA